MKRTPQIFIILLFGASLLGYPSPVSAQSNLDAQVADLQANLERQDKILKTLQGLTAEQARTQGELNRLPLAVEDLDEVLHDTLVKVFTTEMSIAVSGYDLKDTIQSCG